ncbi:unnamed protein product [Protopolystoma xenopodis]|uniref:Uncharacterized protein n=1 Tax=Protopolystoma xenopodis TaxID=117903 RepID=A0A448X6B5_9PLAT|nr:unnamed protein product [Protopolystoma xenopodis]
MPTRLVPLAAADSAEEAHFCVLCEGWEVVSHDDITDRTEVNRAAARQPIRSSLGYPSRLRAQMWLDGNRDRQRFGERSKVKKRGTESREDGRAGFGRKAIKQAAPGSGTSDCPKRKFRFRRMPVRGRLLLLCGIGGDG